LEMGGNVSEGRGPLPLLPQNCRRGALPALSKGVYPCPQPFPAQSTFCYESHLNAEVFQSLLWVEPCTPSRNLHLTMSPRRRRSFGRRSPQSPRLLISRKRTAPRTAPSCGTRHWPRNRSGGPSCTACPMRTVCPVAWPSSGKTRRRSLSKNWLWPRGAGTGDTAGVRRRNDLHRGHVRKQETGALVRAAGLQHYGNPEVRAPPVRGVFHGEERVRAGRLGQGGARVGCGVRKIDQAFNLDD